MEICVKKMKKSIEIIEKLNKIKWDQFPKFKELKTNKLRSYFIMLVLDQELGIKYLSVPEISKIIKIKFKKTITPQAIRISLNGQIGNEVDTKIEDGVTKYKLLRAGIKQIPKISIKDEPSFSPKEIVICPELFENSKDYLKKVTKQINCCYKYECYDACSVMIRRLFETLIVDIYEHKNIESKIKKADGSYFMFGDLIKKLINEKGIKLSSQTKNYFPKIKFFGDIGAHNRTINIRKHQIEKNIDNLEICASELISELK